MKDNVRVFRGGMEGGRQHPRLRRPACLVWMRASDVLVPKKRIPKARVLGHAQDMEGKEGTGYRTGHGLHGKSRASGLQRGGLPRENEARIWLSGQTWDWEEGRATMRPHHHIAASQHWVMTFDYPSYVAFSDSMECPRA